MGSFDLNHSMTSLVCGECGVLYAIPMRLHESREKCGGAWHCPNGHLRTATTRTVADVEADLKRAREELTAVRDERWRFRTLWQRALKRAKQAEAKR